MEILPIKILTDDDAPVFGKLNVDLGKLQRLGIPVANGLVVTPPDLHLKTTLEHFDFENREVFEQSLNLLKKELENLSVPDVFQKEIKKHTKLVKKLWLNLLFIWVEQIKKRLWKDGFSKGLTENLEPQVLIFVNKIEASGNAFFDPNQQEVIINIVTGSLKPNDQKKLDEVVRIANKKLFMPHVYQWIKDTKIVFSGIKPYTPTETTEILRSNLVNSRSNLVKIKSAIKVFLDLSIGLVIQQDIDGIYIQSEKIKDWEELVHKIVESAITFPDKPVLVKLSGNTLGSVTDAIDFARHKHSLRLPNVHVVIPFVRIPNELIQIKRDLAVKKLMRKNSLQLWMEAATPENIINLEEYLLQGVDGVVLNLDELIAHLNGFDHTNEELGFYKKQVSGLLKFLENGIKLLHKEKVSFIAQGGIVLEKEILEFLVAKGVYGIVVEKYDAPSAKDLLYQVEKKNILSPGAN